MNEKPARHYYMRLNSNGAITYLELEPDEIPKHPPMLGEPDFDPRGRRVKMVDGAGELAYRAQLTMRGLALLDPQETLSLGDAEKDKEVAERTLDEGL